RLASNSLLECLVFGAQMGLLEVEGEKSKPFTDEVDVGEIWEKSISPQEIETIEKLRVELPSLLWQSAGICRGMRDLESAIAQVEIWRQEFASLPLSQTLDNLSPGQTIDFSSDNAENSSVLRNWGELGNLLDIGYLILKSAAFRTESRGGHYRVDYPLTDRDWCRHTLINQSNWYKSELVEE
ncbi:L-aspartate oxidase, partial [Microcoleus sp. herbarium8]